jgi:hypothetical protein
MDAVPEISNAQLQAALANALKKIEALELNTAALSSLSWDPLATTSWDENTGDFSNKQDISTESEKLWDENTGDSSEKQETSSAKNSFLDKLPQEIRDQIFKYLLVNPILSSTKVLEKWGIVTDVWGTRPWGSARTAIGDKYDLHPQILRTCRRIYT